MSFDFDLCRHVNFAATYLMNPTQLKISASGADEVVWGVSKTCCVYVCVGCVVLLCVCVVTIVFLIREIKF